MPRRLPSLNALRAFEATARLGSMMTAADELHVTQSAVSRQVRTLEEELGTLLFRRFHRNLVLTPKGEILAEALSNAFALIGDGVERTTAQTERLTVRAPPTFGIRWLMPRLPRFEALHPACTVEVNLTWHEIGPDNLRHDVGIRFGRGPWPDHCLTPILTERLSPVCSSGFLETHHFRECAEAFARVPLLHCSVTCTDWPRWAKTWGGVPFDVDRGESFDTLDLALRAAEAGRGLAMADLAMIADDLALGRLVLPYPDAVVSGDRYFFVLPDPKRSPPLALAFLQWMLDEAKTSGQEPP